MDIRAGMIFDILSAELFKIDRVGIIDISAGMIVEKLFKNDCVVLFFLRWYN